MMRPRYVRLMDALYYACMALIIGWSVYTRYVLTDGSFWAEPIAIALAVQMTFYGAAACYRANAHIGIDLLVRGFRSRASMMATRLVKTTFFQVYPEFQHIRVGAVYTALPGSGFITLVFVIERLIYGSPGTPAK